MKYVKRNRALWATRWGVVLCCVLWTVWNVEAAQRGGVWDGDMSVYTLWPLSKVWEQYTCALAPGVSKDTIVLFRDNERYTLSFMIDICGPEQRGLCDKADQLCALGVSTMKLSALLILLQSSQIDGKKWESACRQYQRIDARLSQHIQDFESEHEAFIAQIRDFYAVGSLRQEGTTLDNIFGPHTTFSRMQVGKCCEMVSHIFEIERAQSMRDLYTLPPIRSAVQSLIQAGCEFSVVFFNALDDIKKFEQQNVDACVPKAPTLLNARAITLPATYTFVLPGMCFMDGKAQGIYGWLDLYDLWKIQLQRLVQVVQGQSCARSLYDDLMQLKEEKLKIAGSAVLQFRAMIDQADMWETSHCLAS